MKKPTTCPFFNICVQDPPKDVSCEKNYEECNHYGWFYHYSTLAIPKVCPYWKNGCQQQCVDTDISPSHDYRDCEHFSRWFWETKAKTK